MSTSFVVMTYAPLDEIWEQRKEAMDIAAGREPDFFAAGKEVGKPGEFDCEWYVRSCADAIAMRLRLAAVEGVVATFREI